MISDELRRRISEMNRAALKRSSPLEARVLPLHNPIESPAAARFLPLHTAVPGGVVVEWPPSQFLCIERPLGSFCSGIEEFTDRYQSCFQRPDLFGDRDVEFIALASRPISSWVFLDIETCGLTNSCVFLIGLLGQRGGEFFMEQFLARDYGEEASILHYLTARLREVQALLTFNGKSFDWPFLQDRGLIHSAMLPEPPLHFDVLHAARKRWKKTLPNCKLQTLERHVCRRTRYGDIPGALIPEVYHEFVKTGNAWDLRTVLHHNALDLFTTSEITLHLFTGGDADSL